MNLEVPDHKTGLIGEYLVKIRLNSCNVNTGSVDKDTGTDIVLFYGKTILTAQVKTGVNNWNHKPVRDVHIHFKVKLHKQPNGDILLDKSEIKWKRTNCASNRFKLLTCQSIKEIFDQKRTQLCLQRESELLLQINQTLPPPQRKRLNLLIKKRQSHTITSAELQELKQMTHEIEKSDARRLKGLIELAALRNVPLDDLIKQLGLKPYPHD